ncbi:hypothetical protein NQ176_g342 [Zarea fungicola]|uniref:Uncharacterized protein n=1 Tax=Zarea fungicola TaxID=93591 RepID=A0ACC1NYD4_9HYPO|nr:hypothetical protein NQ176_g342 [Lecanicillium fungicola]
MAKTEKESTPRSQGEVTCINEARILQELNITEDDLAEAKDIGLQYSVAYAWTLVSRFYVSHKDDFNVASSALNRMADLLSNDGMLDNGEKYGNEIAELRIYAAIISHNSPYAPVRAVTDNSDDVAMPCSTIRAWFIGLFLALILMFLNDFFSIRFPTISIGTNVAQLLAYPIGVSLAKALPDWGFTAFGVRHSLNPGPFTKKEHMLTTIIAMAAPGEPYTQYMIWIQVLPWMYNQQWAQDFGYQICITLSISMLGYSFAGLLCPLLVQPAYCIFPDALATIGLNKAFHVQDSDQGAVPGPFGMKWSLSRLRLFLYAGFAMFVYFWFPNYLMPALTYFSWMTWIAPTNEVLSLVAGFQSGFGLNPLPTFDWNIVSYFLAPLEIPFWVTWNFFCGTVIGGVALAAVYFTNTLYTAYLPMNGIGLFDRFGMPYNLSQIITSDGRLDEAAYHAYSPPYLPAALLLNYVISFAVTAGIMVQIPLFHWREIWTGLKQIWSSLRGARDSDEEEHLSIDLHSRLMHAYKPVPSWWYAACGLGSVTLGLVGILHWPTGASPGAPFYGVWLAVIFLIPDGIIYAVTGISWSANLVAEWIGGAVSRGNAIDLVFLKAYGTNVGLEAIAFSRSMKIGHYAKIPHRVVFAAQVIPTIISAFVALGILKFQMSLEGVCTPHAPYRFLCRTITVFQNSAILWGTLGPERIFGTKSMYATLLAGFAAGPAFIVVIWLLRRRFPHVQSLHNLSPVVLLQGFAGIAISGIVQFFAVQYNPVQVDWWGTEIVTVGCDGMGGCPWLDMPESGSFGPGAGEFA